MTCKGRKPMARFREFLANHLWKQNNQYPGGMNEDEAAEFDLQAKLGHPPIFALGGLILDLLTGRFREWLVQREQ
jgi:hypothetical protein